MMIPDTIDQSAIQQTVAHFDELHTLIGDLGKDGGIISPSVYDTAQVLRFYPPEEGVEPVLEWLLSQQQADGGWGDPSVPLTRDMPTLAAILAISKHASSNQATAAVMTGVDYLNKSQAHWTEPLPMSLPVGIELIFPSLLRDTRIMGLPLNEAAYSSLILLGNRRRKLISESSQTAGSPATFSWEAWGKMPRLHLVDTSTGSVGHSPAATAFWLRIWSEIEGPAGEKRSGRGYLDRANRALSIDIPGIYPTAWPINRFEQAFGLHALLMANLLFHPALTDVVSAQLKDLSHAFSGSGIGFSDHFEADGDDTFAAAAVLLAGDYTVSPSVFQYFQRDQHFTSYPYELQSSPSVTARAVHALRYTKEDVLPYQHHLIQAQEADGRWDDDKWNCSWLYTTSVVLSALEGTDATRAQALAHELLLSSQDLDGGYSSGSSSTQTETAYALLALLNLVKVGMGRTATFAAIERARGYLLHTLSLRSAGHESLWLNKELYKPHRIDQMFVLAALLASNEVLELASRQ